ncbi:hypothetical protein [Halosimplex pelagicum]|uniref:Uncharacterized protein n=1 Tax=Halosimplex pelagicum TaxID=869886 RepID=A0A7D5P9D2_9EURY|nr:hypothetical protein [Halosimplex pelagicum]QLH82465.1 hypothetical protein HZS54_12945 [Halosimplex pelagicum]QLH82521.1 hypothetical protein HZS54_13250 [Halosimplex pelagicum]
MDDAEYWLPWWWDMPVTDPPFWSGPQPSPPGPAIQIEPQAVALPAAVADHQGPPDIGGSGGPPPAAGAAVAVDDETMAELRRIKEVKERQRRMIGR